MIIVEIYHAIMRLWAKLAGKDRDPWTSVLALCLLLTSCTSYAGELPAKGVVISHEQALQIAKDNGLVDIVDQIERYGFPEKRMVSDGCSGGCPDIWHGVDIYPYCYIHDLGYWAGGSRLKKFRADVRLMTNIAEATRDPDFAVIVFNGVWLGGGLPAAWQWGNVGVE